MEYKKKKRRELEVGQLVAAAINQSEGTDYQAVACQQRAPDVRLVSASCPNKARFAEVVRTPFDPAIHHDNDNARRYERTLHGALRNAGISQRWVTVRWTEGVLRRRIDDRRIIQLGGILAPRIRASDHFFAYGTDLYHLCPEVSKIVHYVDAYRFESLRLTVSSSHSFWMPQDGRWIEAAIEKKIRKRYDRRAASGWMLIIDGNAYLDREQMDAFRESSKLEETPFAEIWAVSMGKAYRLKP